MDVDNDPGFLVVDLEQCVSADLRNLSKSSIYSHSLSPGSCHDVLHLGSPVQNLSGDLNQSLYRIQHHPLSQLQPVHYQQVQVDFDANSSHSLSPLYHNPALQNYSSASGYSCSFLNSLSPVDHSSIPIPSTSSPPLKPPPPPPPLPPPPKERRKHTDPNDVPHFPINDYEYYKEIEQLLVKDKYPEGASDNYKKHLRKRARHYLIINDELYHNPKKPKKVVMRKLEQMNLLESTHITPGTGIHLGIKKMLDLIHAEYFWRGLYEDVANFVNTCPKCRDSVDLAQRREKQFRRLGEDFSDDEMEDAYATTSVQTTPIIWTKVEIQLHGPFKITESRNEFVLTVTDPHSCFVHATAIPRIGCAVKITDFILKTFYTFGFPQPYFIKDKELHEEVAREYDSRLKQTAWKTTLHWQGKSDCPWVSQLIELLIIRKSDRWDKEMDKFMFQFRSGFIRDSPSPKDCVPFYSMFQRLPYHEDKENSDLRNRGKIQYQCRDCDEKFTSKVTLRLHTKKHFLEDARKTSILEYAIEKHDLEEGNELEKSRVEVAMGELKNYLAKTKDIRRKRGKYQKYSVELQENMISYAKKHGIRKASSYFSELIGSNVSDSTIRNLMKASVNFLPRTKEDIARYAIECGADKASKYFTEFLKKEVPISLVNKFKILYGGKFMKQNKENSQKDKSRTKERIINDLTDEEKDSIGNYACEHTTLDTIDFYFKKFSIILSESDVEELQKIHLAKEQRSFMENSGENINIANVTYQTLPAGSVCFSPSGSIVQIQDTSYTYEDVGFHTPLHHQQNVRLQEELQNTELEQEEGVEECPVVDHFLLVTEESPTRNEINTSEKQEDSMKSQEWSNQCYQVVSEESQIFPVEATSASEVQGKIIEVAIEPTNNIVEESFSCQKTTKSSKKKESGKKRGSYTTYSPELRAKIGKYAAEHGSLKASNHFSKILGHDLPESTARGLKERYLCKVRHCDVTSLGYSTRGRPLRLGKYDEVVQECLKELVSSGEKITSFLAITTAKQILNKLEPSLLQENGGTVVLNNTWAKSIMKRIGVRNNS